MGAANFSALVVLLPPIVMHQALKGYTGRKILPPSFVDSCLDNLVVCLPTSGKQVSNKERANVVSCLNWLQHGTAVLAVLT